MTEIFYQKKKENQLDNLVIDVKKIYEKYPISKKIFPSPNLVKFTENYFHKIYKSSFIPKKIRNYLWHIFRRLNLDLSWFREFNKYWSKILGARPFWDINDLFFLKNVYRLKFQYNILPESDDPYLHLEAWQCPEVIYQLLFLVCKEIFANSFNILNILKKKKKKINSILEFGCGTAPITTSLFEFHRLSKNIKIFISDIQTIAFHYAAFKFRRCSNVISVLLEPENNFLLKLNEKVDVIFCLAVFEHLNKPIETINIFYKTLNKGGLLVFDYKMTEGEGLDTHISAKERNSVLDFIEKKFNIIFGRISKEKDIGLTIVRKNKF